MREYTSYEIQEISSNFRSVARRLSKTDYSQCGSNLRRFMSMLHTEELIADYITRSNTVTYNIPEIIEKREFREPFAVSPVQEEEISQAVQMLDFAVDHFDGNFTRLYGTHFYTSTSSTVGDEMRKFIEHIIDPLIDHVAEYLHHCYEEAVRKEEGEKRTASPSFTAHNSTVVIDSHVIGNVSTEVAISESTQSDANDLVVAIREALEAENIPSKEDIEEILSQVQEEINSGKKPRKGLLTALKVLCKAGTTVIPFVTALLELF